VTVFTVGELFTMSALALIFHGGLTPLLGVLALAMLGFLIACGRVLWKRTRFS
jgi:hypothetical protein